MALFSAFLDDLDADAQAARFPFLNNLVAHALVMLRLYGFAGVVNKAQHVYYPQEAGAFSQHCQKSQA